MNLKNIFSAFGLFTLLLVSCTNKDDVVVVSTPKTISGTFAENDLPQVLEFNGRTLVFEKQVESQQNIGRNVLRASNAPAEAAWEGPFYATEATMSKIYSNTKVIINQSNVPEIIIPTGVYFCDVYIFNKQIDFPLSVAAVRVLTPTSAPYSNYSNQTKGVNWTMVTLPDNSLRLSIYYYTLVVNYSSNGQSFGGRVIPIDGRTVSIPYLTLSF